MSRVVKTLDATIQQEIDISPLDTLPHVQIGLQFQESVGVPVMPSAGTYTIEVRAVGQNDWESVLAGVDVDSTQPYSLLTFNGGNNSLRYTPDGITDAPLIKFVIQGFMA